MSLDDQINSALKHEIQHRLIGECVPRIRKCVEMLSEEQVWWRPNPESNSIGNLVIHLSGNVRQWIISGIGGLQDVRTRQDEFDEQGPMSNEELLGIIESTMLESKAIIETVTPVQLLEQRSVQIYEESVLSILIHVTEHFSYHTGQIAWITKMLTEKQVGFYEGIDL